MPESLNIINMELWQLFIANIPSSHTVFPGVELKSPEKLILTCSVLLMPSCFLYLMAPCKWREIAHHKAQLHLWLPGHCGIYDWGKGEPQIHLPLWGGHSTLWGSGPLSLYLLLVFSKVSLTLLVSLELISFVGQYLYGKFRGVCSEKLENSQRYQYCHH